MLGLDAQISIISYAVVSTKYKEKNSIFNSFLPLIEHILVACKDKTISKKELISLFKEIYGYDMPAAILDTLLRKLKEQGKIDFLVEEKVEIYEEELLDYDSKYELDIRTLKSDFTIFLKKRRNLPLSISLHTVLLCSSSYSPFFKHPCPDGKCVRATKGILCKGSTSDFDSDRGGSNPPIPGSSIMSLIVL